jgi:hypothetical protein
VAVDRAAVPEAVVRAAAVVVVDRSKHSLHE